MTIQRDFRRAATVIAVLMMSSNAGAQGSQRRLNMASSTSENHQEMTGILTDRLTKSQLKILGSIMEIVLAKDQGGRPVHPNLYGLYQRAANSGHAIFVELTMHGFSYSSLGGCRIESQGAGTQNATVVMRLNLGMIERTRVSERNRRADGFIPFAGLGKKERYAEVLGHELTHAVLLLMNADYLALYRERKAQVNTVNQDGRALEGLTSLIEKPAEAAEEEVWRELKAGQKSRRMIRSTEF
jgi:hypothetical protein